MTEFLTCSISRSSVKPMRIYACLDAVSLRRNNRPLLLLANEFVSQWFEMFVIVVETLRVASSSGFLSSSPTSTNMSSRNGSSQVRAYLSLYFILALATFYDDSNHNIVQPNNIEETTFHLSLLSDRSQTTSFLPCFRLGPALTISLDIIVPRGIENKVAISMSRLNHS